MDIRNTIAIITVISKGIGYLVTNNLLQHIAKFFGLWQNNNTITYPNYQFIKCDVRNFAEVEKAFTEI